MKKLKSLDQRLLTILLIVFVQMVGAAMIVPILPLYAQRRFALEPQVITLLITVFFAAQALAGPYLGRLSDKVGRVPVLIVSQIGTAASFFMIAFAPSVAVLFAARILDGITGGNVIVTQAYITDITPPAKRTQSLGLIFAVFGLGFIVGPALGGLLSALFGPTVPFVGAGAAAFLTVLLTWRVLDETLTPEQRLKNRQTADRSLSPGHIVKNGSLMLILLIVFVGQFGMGLLQATFALFGEAVLFRGYAPQMVDLGIGMLLSVVGVSQILTQTVLLPRAVARFRDTLIVVIGLSSRTAGLFVFALAAMPLTGVVAAVFFALGMGLMMPPLQSLTTYTVPDELRGGALGVYQSTISVAVIISTAVAGVLFALDVTLPYWLAGGLGLAALVPAVLLHRRMGKVGAVTPVTAVSD